MGESTNRPYILFPFDNIDASVLSQVVQLEEAIVAYRKAVVDYLVYGKIKPGYLQIDL